MWQSGNALRRRRHAHGDAQPKCGGSQSRHSTCDTGSASHAAAPRNAGGWPCHRHSAHHTTSPTACPATGRWGKKCQLMNHGHMSLQTTYRRVDCAGVSRHGLGMAASGGPGDSRHNQRPALPPRGREGLVLGHLAAFGTAGVRALTARATGSARPCTPRWRRPRARSTSSCCLAWWIRQTRPRHRRPNLSPL